MTVSTGFPIKRAIVETLRDAAALVQAIAAARGGSAGKWLHEGFAPEKTAYPFVTYQQVYGPYNYLWGSVLLRAGFDVKVYSENSVEANNLFALLAAELDEAELPVAGQSTLICRRIADLGSPEANEEGKKVYMVGGTYEVVTDQPLLQKIRRAGSFTLDAVIV
jgi:Protein of unknown function (DUF3168)